MTPAELYEWAKARRLEDAPIRIDSECTDSQVTYPEVRNVCKDTYTVVICIEDEM